MKVNSNSTHVAVNDSNAFNDYERNQTRLANLLSRLRRNKHTVPPPLSLRIENMLRHAEEQRDTDTAEKTKTCVIVFRQASAKSQVMFRAHINRNYVDFCGRDEVLELCLALTKYDPAWKFSIRASSKGSIDKSRAMMQSLQYLSWLWNFPPFDMTYVATRKTKRIHSVPC